MICNSDQILAEGAATVGATITIRYLWINHRLLTSLDSFHDLQPIYTKSFVNRLYLVLQIGKILTQIFFAFTPLWN